MLNKAMKKVQKQDLKHIVKRNFAIPISSYGLKDVGSFFGFDFNEELDGLIVASEYMRSQDKGGLLKEREEEFLNYNKDDVLAIDHILQNTIYDIQGD